MGTLSAAPTYEAQLLNGTAHSDSYFYENFNDFDDDPANNGDEPPAYVDSAEFTTILCMGSLSGKAVGPPFGPSSVYEAYNADNQPRVNPEDPFLPVLGLNSGDSYSFRYDFSEPLRGGSVRISDALNARFDYKLTLISTDGAEWESQSFTNSGSGGQQYLGLGTNELTLDSTTTQTSGAGDFGGSAVIADTGSYTGFILEMIYNEDASSNGEILSDKNVVVCLENFSFGPVPEPSSLGLVALGGLLALRRKRN
ncbi:PEP-CTERM sorting domain-containing protein [Roseibacillus ishigakijimensis]|uniref:PEP-CTERM sorting domain-containing protein n=1 Tax=Roseibacillus ishigakijimensis TaxID=454146 RepID=UPI0036721298